jgi:hypothetical protein
MNNMGFDDTELVDFGDDFDFDTEHGNNEVKSEQPIRENSRKVVNNRSNVNRRKTLVNVDKANSEYLENFDVNEFNGGLIEDRTVQELNEADEKKRNKVKTPEQKKKQKIIIGCVAGGVVAILAGLIVYKQLHSDPGVDFTAVDIASYMNGVTEAELETTSESTETTNLNTLSEVTAPTTVTEEREKKLRKFTEVKDLTSANVGEALKINVKVNTKLDDDDSYKDYESYYHTGLLEVISGYSNVKEVVDAYNKTGKKLIELGEESDFSDDITVAIFRVSLDYPLEYPTTDGIAYEVPNVKLSLHGTYVDERGEKDYSNSIVINDNAYSIVPAVPVFDEPNKVDIYDGFDYDFLVKIPKGVTENAYYITVNVNDDAVIYNGVTLDKDK